MGQRNSQPFRLLGTPMLRGTPMSYATAASPAAPRPGAAPRSADDTETSEPFLRYSVHLTGGHE
jgi:hypothetical protein